jgi:magnesium transporter
VDVGEGNELRAHEAGIFVTRNALVTVRSDEGFDIAEVMRRWDGTPTLAAGGVGYLLHGVLDYAVDTQFQAVQRLDTEVDALEDRVFDERTTDAALQRRAFQMRKSLVLLRRLVLPMIEVVNTLIRRNPEITDGAMMPYFQDVYDHAVRAGDLTDSLRDLAANILETRLNVRSNRLNVTVKKVTSWAAIIAVPTAVTGFYGQNVPYPGYGAAWGFWVSTVVIVIACVALYAIFKRMDWL